MKIKTPTKLQDSILAELAIAEANPKAWISGYQAAAAGHWLSADHAVDAFIEICDVYSDHPSVAAFRLGYTTFQRQQQR